jgi:hypothetical protein
MTVLHQPVGDLGALEGGGMVEECSPLTTLFGWT